MKYLFLVFLLTASVIAAAQPTAADIKKFKIKKAVEKRIDESGTAESYWYYDRNGYDSLQSWFEESVEIKNTFKNGKLVEKRLLKMGNSAGKKDDVYTYEYKPDGSYKETFTDGDYQMKSYEWYNKKGDVLKSQSPDGNTTTYKYDAKGKLLSIISDGYNYGIKINHRNTYNAKGQLIKQQRDTDGEKMTVTYTYDAKGKLNKQVWTGAPDAGIPTTTSVFEYNDKGLVTKKTSTSVSPEDGRSAEIVYVFEYEYY